MCVKPTVVYRSGATLEKKKVACRRCWACMKNKTNDLVGRMLCEASTALWTCALTLTYDDKKLVDPSQTKLIHKKDFQDFVRALRDSDHKCRYVVAGEYGERKSRTHFHAVMFGYGKPFDVPNKTEKVYLDQWRWGYTYADWTVDERAMRYVAKYLTKHLLEKKSDAHSLEWVSYSKKPLLGFEFIAKKALRQAEMRVFPQTFNYVPPGAKYGERYSFYGKAQEVYLDVLMDAWPGAAEAKKSEWGENAFRRWKEKKKEEAWDRMTTAEQEEAIMERFPDIDDKPDLTPAQRLRKGWEDYDRKFEFRELMRLKNGKETHE